MYFLPIYYKEKVYVYSRRMLNNMIENIVQNQNIIEIICPTCKKNIWSFSKDYIEQTKKVYCPFCDDFIDANISFHLPKLESIFKWKDSIETTLEEKDFQKMIENLVKFQVDITN